MPIDYEKISEENTKKYGTHVSNYGRVLLANLYNDRTHFIYELIQNAEDTEATQVDFHLYSDRIEFRHNGRLFNEADVRGICGIVDGTKRDELTQIGQFGIGFKSVYAYTKSPMIYSGVESFCVEDYVRPKSIELIESIRKINETLFILPFNHDEISRKQAYDEISYKLNNFDGSVLLFLKNIKNISCSENGKKLIEITSKKSNKKRIKEVHITQNYFGNANTRNQSFIVFEKTWKKLQKIEIAFKVEKSNNKTTILPIPHSKLVAFFPTELDTYLNFIIQGPYITIPNRENIPLKNQENIKIINATGELLEECMTTLKNTSYYNFNFLSLLPIKDEYKNFSPIYTTLYNQTQKALLKGRFLPTISGSYAKKDEAILAKGNELLKLLNSEDIKKLYAKKHWLDSEVSHKRFEEIRNYLVNEIGIKEVDFENFAGSINLDFIKIKSDKWMIDLYENLLNHESLWKDNQGIIRRKPIIRLDNNEHISPYGSDNIIQAYLPLKTPTKYKTVKKFLLKSKKAGKFLKELGLKKPDNNAEVTELILPKFRQEKTAIDKDYYSDIKKIIKCYEMKTGDEKSRFIDELEQLKFIYAKDNLSNKSSLYKPTEVYLANKQNKKYFEGYSAKFVSDTLIKEYGNDKKIIEFLEGIGATDLPRRIKIPGELSKEEKESLKKGEESVYGHISHYPEEIVDYSYEGLENSVSNISFDKSILIWETILKDMPPYDYDWAFEEFLQGKFTWYYRKHRSAKFTAKFVKTLRNYKWLYDKDKKLVRPSEVRVDELHHKYLETLRLLEKGDLKKRIVEVFVFKPNLDVYSGLPKDEHKMIKMIKAQGITPKKLQKLIDDNKIKESLEEESWNPRLSPVEIEPVAIRKQSLRLPTENPNNQKKYVAEIESNDDYTNSHESSQENDKKRSAKDSKAIGRWGEEFVNNYLNRKFQSDKNTEIIWLNSEKESGVGCDFILKRFDKEIEYIEVKAKISEDPQLVDISGTQWEFGRNLYSKGEGEKFSIYVVCNAGNTNARIEIINNPAKLWQEGMLYAHPISVRL